MASNFLEQLLNGGTAQRPAMYPREDNEEDQFALMANAGWFNQGSNAPQVTQFDPMATDSRLGNAPQVEKEKNQLNALFQGAVFSGDLDKAARLAVTPEQQALLDVAYGQRMNRQAGGQGNLMADYQKAQDTTLARSRMEQDRQYKIRQMNDESRKTRAEATNLEIKDPTAADWVMGPNGMYNKRTGATRPLPNGGLRLKPGEVMSRDGASVQMIPGSEGYQKQANAHAKDYAGLQALETKTQNAIDKIDEILKPENDDAFNSQFGGYNAYATRLIPGATQDIGARIDSLKANMKTAGLELIRQGGSIGQMTEREWPIVQDQLDRLDPRMSEKAAREAFANIKNTFEKVRNAARETYAGEWGNSQFAKNNAAQPPNEAIQHLRANPGLRVAFEMKYGKGSSAKVLDQ